MVDHLVLLSLGLHVEEQVGEVFGVDQGKVDDGLTGGASSFLLGVERAVLDRRADVEAPHEDPLLGNGGLQGLEVVALGRQAGGG